MIVFRAVDGDVLHPSLGSDEIPSDFGWELGQEVDLCIVVKKSETVVDLNGKHDLMHEAKSDDSAQPPIDEGSNDLVLGQRQNPEVMTSQAMSQIAHFLSDIYILGIFPALDQISIRVHVSCEILQWFSNRKAGCCLQSDLHQFRRVLASQ